MGLAMLSKYLCGSLPNHHSLGLFSPDAKDVVSTCALGAVELITKARLQCAAALIYPHRNDLAN